MYLICLAPYLYICPQFDQGIVQLVKKLPRDSALEKLQEISYHRCVH